MSEILTGKIQEAKESYGRYKTVRNEMEAMVKVFSENQLTDVTENCEFIKKKYQHQQMLLQDLKSLDPDVFEKNTHKELEKYLQ